MKYDVRVSNLRPDGAVKAYASVNINEEFAITGVKVMEGSNGLFVAMPSYKTQSGEYRDICFPITKEGRKNFDLCVLSSYEQAIQQLQGQAHGKEDIPTQTQEMQGM